MNVFKKVLLSVFFVSCMATAREYVPTGNPENTYETLRQIQKLFKSVGCKHSNCMEIDYPQFCEIKPRKTEFYKADAKNIDTLSKKYEKDVLEKKLAPMYLKWISPEIGHGIFAATNIAPGDFIGVYAGELRAVRSGDDKNPEDLDYAWYYTIDTHDGKKLIIDGKHRGNELRFINHATYPNTKRIDVIVGDRFYVCYVAQQTISRDMQLTVSYGDGLFQETCS
ncbi:MAG: SET domain-containing protein-lysine N-methyltransferase [Candidatus Dependentiae bacterium]|nr:SET domain-containing protein-lysine N-methyltransferase [Candidatus Dependentiae bacterium]